MFSLRSGGRRTWQLYSRFAKYWAYGEYNYHDGYNHLKSKYITIFREGSTSGFVGFHMGPVS